MRYWILYHNYDDLGYLPADNECDTDELAGLDTAGFEESGATTSKRMISRAVGDVLLSIVGYGGRPKKYVLWSWMTIEDVEERSDGRFDAYGDGRILNPLPALSGDDFDRFKKENGNFGLGFREITKSPYLPRLLELARLHAGLEPDSAPYDRPLPEEVDPSKSYSDGAVRQVTLNAYERNPQARRQCIEHHGATCRVCETDMADIYGEVANGLIHVHHLRPLGEVRTEHDVDPVKDLLPVCPNCHAVIHLRKPPFTADEVRRFLRKAGGSRDA